MNKVSVIIPVYNVEKYLRQCLDSVINQTLQEIEIICIDDGSSDGSWLILEEYASRDYRIRILNQKNAGAGAARNRGLELATGEYLSFLDSDDFFEQNMLELAYAKAKEDDADIVVFRADFYWNNSDYFKPAPWTLQKKRIPAICPFAGTDIMGNPFRAFIGWAWDKLFRTAFIREKGYLFQEQRTSNDLLFVFSAVTDAKRITILDETLAHQRRAISSSLSVTREKSWDCFYYALIALREHLQRVGSFEKFKRDYIDYALHFSLWNINSIKGPAYEKLYNKLKGEWFKELGIEQLNAQDFEVKSEYQQYRYIKRTPFFFYKRLVVIVPIIQKIDSICRYFRDYGMLCTLQYIMGKIKKMVSCKLRRQAAGK
ncbi:Glycosyltransferase involved in cell wall bisynthesis [Desulfotomaculum arcticum]|uniref:Glycosyltransferase involved in cell wall bisynthesis n=2 Tax=Desulfotruncus TaxID=2867377 RepID=A0A1I2X017_9FIRM|nr:Glycosyltransferase involved in cell wall bisynthesis [Desulfotomaculum arcticum] [Desulfotruncus arcticus DSM 17038]